MSPLVQDLIITVVKVLVFVGALQAIFSGMTYIERHVLAFMQFRLGPNRTGPFLAAMETEIRANGSYSITGFNKTQDAAMGDMKFAGGDIVYDPTLDDMGRSKFGYWLDTSKIQLMVMEDEWMHRHTPSRPYDKFVMFRSITSTCQVVAKGLNSSAVIDIA